LVFIPDGYTVHKRLNGAHMAAKIDPPPWKNPALAEMAIDG
jgi:hypothetical protein